MKVTRKKCFLSYILYLGVKEHNVARIYQPFYFGIYNKYVFIDKINTIKMKFPFWKRVYQCTHLLIRNIIMPACTAVFDTFHPLSCDVLSSLIRTLNKTTCVLDPFPTKILMSHLSFILDIILSNVNLCFSFSIFTTSCKSSIIFLQVYRKMRLKGGLECNSFLLFCVGAIHTNYATVLVEFWLRK